MVSIDEASKQKEYISVGMDFTLECTDQVLKHLNGDEREKKLKEMRDIMLGFVMMERDYTQSLEVIQSMSEQLHNMEISNEENGKTVDIQKIFRNMKKDIQEDNSLDSLYQHQQYQNLDLRIKETLREEKRGTEEDDDDDEAEDSQDIIFTQSDVTTKDPLTKKEMTNPVKSLVCGHSYEKDTIMQMIKKNRKFRCPYIGCQNREPLKETDLKEDKELKRIIQQKQDAGTSHRNRPH